MGLRPLPAPEFDPEATERSAGIYGVGPDGDVHVLYSPEFKPQQPARGVRVLAAS
jgi:hypothetical protein